MILFLALPPTHATFVQVVSLTIALRCVRRSRSKASKALRLHEAAESFRVRPGPQEMTLGVSRSQDCIDSFIRGHNAQVRDDHLQQEM